MEIEQVIQSDVLGKRSTISKQIWVRMRITYLGIERRQLCIEERVSGTRQNIGNESSEKTSD